MSMQFQLIGKDWSVWSENLQKSNNLLWGQASFSMKFFLIFIIKQEILNVETDNRPGMKYICRTVVMFRSKLLRGEHLQSVVFC